MVCIPLYDLCKTFFTGFAQTFITKPIWSYQNKTSKVFLGFYWPNAIYSSLLNECFYVSSFVSCWMDLMVFKHLFKNRHLCVINGMTCKCPTELLCLFEVRAGSLISLILCVNLGDEVRQTANWHMNSILTYQSQRQQSVYLHSTHTNTVNIYQVCVCSSCCVLLGLCNYPLATARLQKSPVIAAQCRCLVPVSEKSIFPFHLFSLILVSFCCGENIFVYILSKFFHCYFKALG